MTDKSYTEAMAEVGTQMARLEGKLDTGLAELNGSVKALTTVVEAGNQARIDEARELRKDVDDHETRIRSLESLVWKAMGGAVVLSLVGGWIISAVF